MHVSQPAVFRKLGFVSLTFVIQSRIEVKRKTFGDGYFSALTKQYAELPESCDFVMYWWHKAAELVRANRVRRFGFITTKRISRFWE